MYVKVKTESWLPVVPTLAITSLMLSYFLAFSYWFDGFKRIFASSSCYGGAYSVEGLIMKENQ